MNQLKKRKFDQFPDPENDPIETTSTSISTANSSIKRTSIEIISQTGSPSLLVKMYVKVLFNSKIQLEELTPIKIDNLINNFDSYTTYPHNQSKTKDLLNLIALCVNIIHNNTNTIIYAHLVDRKILKLPCALASEYGSEYLDYLLQLIEPQFMSAAILTCVAAASGSGRDYLIPHLLSFVEQNLIPESAINLHILIGSCRSNRLNQIKQCLQCLQCLQNQSLSKTDLDLAASAAITSSNSELYLALLYFGASNFSFHLMVAQTINCPFVSQIESLSKIDNILSSVFSTSTTAIAMRLLNCAQLTNNKTLANNCFTKEKSDLIIQSAKSQTEPFIVGAIDQMTKIIFKPFAENLGLINSDFVDQEVNQEVNQNSSEGSMESDEGLL